MKKTLFAFMLLLLLTAMLYAQSGAEENTYVSDAIDLLDKLYAGDLSAADRIDWNNLELFFINYGEEYIKLSDEPQKQDYRDIFIKDFVDRCSDEGLVPDDLSGWSLGNVTDAEVIIYADWDPDWIYMIFTKDGSKVLLREIYIEYDDYGDY